MNDISNLTVLIPALEPGPLLIPYVEHLKEKGLCRFVIVDDGSGSEYDNIFEPMKEIAGCHVIRYETNRGKGYALKTGYKYIKHHNPECRVITVDSDGQHLPDDVVKIAVAIEQHPKALILGVRDFSQSGIPHKSYVGNRFTSVLFYIFHRKWLSDTQTGLRGFDSTLLDTMSEAPGDRFEYETRVLVDCVKKNIEIVGVPIDTVYFDSNKGSHFRTFRDSAKVMQVLFGSFFRFFCSSVLSTAVDLGLAFFLFDRLRSELWGKDFLRISAATAIARFVSVCLNYTLNSKFVFKSSERKTITFFRYILLCILIMSLSALFVYILSTSLGANEKPAKLLADGLLFFLSYYVQSRWVFRKQGENGNDEQKNI